MKTIAIFVLGAFLQGCSVEPVPINYGSDQCHFCKMTIVDQQHAAEIVTKKGRAYMFDAIECMMNELKRRDEEDVQFFLVGDYSKPKELINAKSAFYLISEEIPSPMGHNLSAFSMQSERRKFISEKSGEALNWDDLKLKFK